jgi:hypothetical protein
MTIVWICWLKLQKLDYNARNGQYKIRSHFYCSVSYSRISLKEGNVMLNFAMHGFEKREVFFYNENEAKGYQ